MSITPEEYKYICQLIHQRSGIELQDDRQYLVENRLEPIAKKLGFTTLSEMISKTRNARVDDPTSRAIVDAMTTNESLFFRDGYPFELLKNKIIPELMKARQATKKIRIWSAACSTGQEPYSIVMAYLDTFIHLPEWQLEIVATDLSDNVLAKAREGFFSQFEVQRGLTDVHLKKYFSPAANGWKVNDSVKKYIQFSNANLIDPNLNFGTFDIIFCRNVLIYFNGETKGMVFKTLSRSLAPDGYLILGGAESPMGISTLWGREPGDNPFVFRKAA
jgi:chemotaxis protein methyltransferase CheR